MARVFRSRRHGRYERSRPRQVHRSVRREWTERRRDSRDDGTRAPRVSETGNGRGTQVRRPGLRRTWEEEVHAMPNRSLLRQSVSKRGLEGAQKDVRQTSGDSVGARAERGTDSGCCCLAEQRKRGAQQRELVSRHQTPTNIRALRDVLQVPVRRRVHVRG